MAKRSLTRARPSWLTRDQGNVPDIIIRRDPANANFSNILYETARLDGSCVSQLPQLVGPSRDTGINKLIREGG